MRHRMPHRRRAKAAWRVTPQLRGKLVSSYGHRPSSALADLERPPTSRLAPACLVCQANPGGKSDHVAGRRAWLITAKTVLSALFPLQMALVPHAPSSVQGQRSALPFTEKPAGERRCWSRCVGSRAGYGGQPGSRRYNWLSVPVTVTEGCWRWSACPGSAR